MKIDFKLFSGNVSNFSKEKLVSLIAHAWQEIHTILFFIYRSLQIPCANR